MAVDKSVINDGTNLRVPTLPGRWNNLTYNARDVGTNIKGKHIDIFTGEGKSAQQQTFEITGRDNIVCLYPHAASG